MRTIEELEEVRDLVDENSGGSKFPNMTYEQGVAAALDFMSGHLEAEDLEL